MRAKPKLPAALDSDRLAKLAQTIKDEHEATVTGMLDTVRHAMAAGDGLIEARAGLDHGAWLPWLARNCRLSERTAQNYMRLAKNRNAIEAQIRNGVADLSVRSAVKLLAAPKAPAEPSKQEPSEVRTADGSRSIHPV
jgi:hypothetical protein